MAYSLKIRTEVINHVHQGMTVLKWLNRRSQRHSYSWKEFNALLKVYLQNATVIAFISSSIIDRKDGEIFNLLRTMSEHK